MPTQPRGYRSVHAADSEAEQMSQGVTQPQELSFQTSTEPPGQAAGQASSGARGSDGLPQVHSHNPSRGRRTQENTEPLLVLQARELGYSVPYQATLPQLAAIVGCCWQIAAEPSTKKDKNKCRLQNVRSLEQFFLNKQAAVVPANMELRDHDPEAVQDEPMRQEPETNVGPTDSLLAVLARELGYVVPPHTTLAELAAIVGCLWEQAASKQDQNRCTKRNYMRLRRQLSDFQGHPASQSERPKKEPAIVQQARKLGHILPFPCSPLISKLCVKFELLIISKFNVEYSSGNDSKAFSGMLTCALIPS